MGYTTVRISEATHRTLKDLAHEEGRPMLVLLEEAVEALRRRRFLERVNAAFGALRRDARAWPEVERERRAWDATIEDGLAVREGRAEYRARRRPRRRRKQG